MDVPARIHVAPVGYENDRVVLPAEELRADWVILLENEGEDDYPDYADRVRERLDDRDIGHDTFVCDVFDCYDSLGAIAEVVTAFDGDDVYVNLSSGSKVTAIAGMIASMATGATPFYVRAEHYATETESGVAEGVREITELPTYPMDSPTAEEVAVLDYLHEAGQVRKQDIIEFGKRAALPFITDHDAANEKSEYRLLDSHIVDPLAERGYVTVADVGRSKRVELTDLGEKTRQAFRYLLDD
jgi:hypothetical protein